MGGDSTPIRPGINCPGHFGRIVLPHPVLNPMFIPLLVAVLQTVCIHCHRLRLSPYYVATLLPRTSLRTSVGHLARLKQIHNMCSRQIRCQFCGARLLTFKQNGITIYARYTTVGANNGAQTAVLVPATTIYSVLVRSRLCMFLHRPRLHANAGQRHACVGIHRTQQSSL